MPSYPISYTCLDHVGSLSSHSAHKLLHVQTLFGRHLLEHDIDGDEGTCPPDPRATVDDDGTVGGACGAANPTDKLEHGAGVFGDTKVWPIGEVVLCYLTHNAHLRHLCVRGRDV